MRSRDSSNAAPRIVENCCLLEASCTRGRMHLKELVYILPKSSETNVYLILCSWLNLIRGSLVEGSALKNATRGFLWSLWVWSLYINALWWKISYSSFSLLRLQEIESLKLPMMVQVGKVFSQLEDSGKTWNHSLVVYCFNQLVR